MGMIICQAGFGVAAVVTIAAFFGSSLLMLNGRIGASARSPALPAATIPVAAAQANRPAAPPPGSVMRAPLTTTRTVMATPAAGAGGAGGPEPGSTAAKIPPPTPSPRSPPVPHPDPAPVAVAPVVTPPPGRVAADATPPSPTIAPLPAAEIRALLLRGDSAFRHGDLTAARLLYRRAFEAGDPHGALGLGASYDPAFLHRYHLWTQIADRDEARKWYERARDLGAKEAAIRIDQLAAAPAH
jgi:hypothetical protein